MTQGGEGMSIEEKVKEMYKVYYNYLKTSEFSNSKYLNQF